MSPLAGALAGLLLAHAGMASLCLAMDRHHGQVFDGREPSQRRRRGLRVCAAVLLAAALAASRLAWGGSVGGVLWLGLLTAGALLTAGSWSAWPRAAACAAPVTAMAGLAVLATALA